jgi:hypothetical protein
MAILRSVVDVNNGNTGWTKSDVLDALETALANLGFHSGSASSGVPQGVLSPGNKSWLTPSSQPGLWNSGRDINFRHGCPNLGSSGTKNRYFNVTNNGTTSYRVLEEFRFSNTNVDDAADTVYDDRHGLQTGDAIHYAAGITSPDANYVIGGLTADTIYYAIKVDEDLFKVAANATDAGNGVAIDITQATTSGYYFQRASDAAYDNYNVVAELGDDLYFNVDDQSGGEFALCGNTNTYNADRILSEDNAAYFRPSDYGYQDFYTAVTTSGAGTVRFDTRDHAQSEDVSWYAPQDPHPSWTNAGQPGYYGLANYIYVNDTNPAMKGTITLLPRFHNRGGARKPYFKYTVPANGGRGELKLRVYVGAYSYDGPGWVNGITIENFTTGWTPADTFTVPGSIFTGASTPSDLNFGVNTQESSTDAYDGTYSLSITNFGAGSNFYQKHDNGYYAILKNVNDASKTYGTTYYSFNMVEDNDSYLNICAGNDFEWANHYGTSHTSTSLSSSNPGKWRGSPGLDYQSNYNYLSRSNDDDWNRIQYASTSTPTAYPMSLRVYRAQAPQDTNFAVIQFCQTINGNIVPYGTISLHKGATFGSSVFDLDYVWLDTYTEYTTGTRSVSLRYRYPNYTSYAVGQEDGNKQNSQMRAASYGYIRDYNQNSDYQYNNYTCNIDTDNSSSGTEVLTYYRNSTYDFHSSNSVASEADYFRPMKGIPVSINLVPCPYYLPDDFVMLQVSTTPGLATFRPGDTVTVSASEIYEVILAGYQTSQNGLDNVNNNSSMGMLFLARTT